VSRLIELLQEFERLYGGDLPVFLKGRGTPLSVDKTSDPYPDLEIGPYYMGGCCLIDRDKLPQDVKL
jgi:hypothetical protein